MAGDRTYDDDAGWAPLERADRACRGVGISDPRAYLSRALACDRLGLPSAKVTDLERALRLGSSDPWVLEQILARHPDPGRRTLAARLIIANDRASEAQVKAASASLFDCGAEILLHGRRVGPRVSGWVSTRTDEAPALRLRLEDGDSLALALRDDRSEARTEGLTRWTFDAVVGARGPAVLDAIPVSGRTVSLALNPPAEQAPSRTRASRPSADVVDALVTVVVPLYGDPDSLSACLRALDRQTVDGLAVVLVDDASPDPDVRRLALAFCRDGNRHYRRNPLNAGFAASVNLGLSLCAGGDVLILNSDVILPDRAIERLRDAIREAEDIGIAAPLSNDAGNTTFPDPLTPGPVLSPERAAIVDAAARRVNAGRIIDLPSVLGSCLYVSRACLDGIGDVSLAYGRGYFEDVDLCLRARERGFRVVAVCDTYVSHASGRSFGAERYPLIARNGSVLDARFPGHTALDAANDRADPLRSPRAAIEETIMQVADPCVVLLGRDVTARAAIEWRAKALKVDAAPLLRMDWRAIRGGVELSLRGDWAGGPRSLAFSLDDDGGERLRRILARLAILRIEVFEPEALPECVWQWLATAESSLSLLIDSRAAVAVANARLAPDGRDGAAPWGGVSVLPTDRMAAAGLTGRVGLAFPGPRSHPGGVGRRAGALRLGMLMPSLCPPAERLILALARRLGTRGSPRLVVLGRCMDDAPLMASGNSWVTGRIAVTDLPVAIRHHGIDALCLPYRASSHWVLDAADNPALPRAYFDWSPAGIPAAAGDLALDPGAADDHVCDSIVDWCRALRSARAS